jgi:hypothetical protein
MNYLFDNILLVSRIQAHKIMTDQLPYPLADIKEIIAFLTIDMCTHINYNTVIGFIISAFNAGNIDVDLCDEWSDSEDGKSEEDSASDADIYVSAEIEREKKRRADVRFSSPPTHNEIKEEIQTRRQNMLMIWESTLADV